ncbi:MAG: hypothetical protein LBC19_11340 [Tannerella sp.]|jgi:hypothetical protein|nr:hypothetical protein [Tannerella sp.]
MKRKLFTVFACLVFFSHAIYAQDIITKLNGDAVRAIVHEVSAEYVKYKKFERPSGPNYVLAASEIFMIKYENGSRDVFEKNPATGRIQIRHIAADDQHPEARSETRTLEAATRSAVARTSEDVPETEATPTQARSTARTSEASARSSEARSSEGTAGKSSARTSEASTRSAVARTSEDVREAEATPTPARSSEGTAGKSSETAARTAATVDRSDAQSFWIKDDGTNELPVPAEGETLYEGKAVFNGVDVKDFRVAFLLSADKSTTHNWKIMYKEFKHEGLTITCIINFVQSFAVGENTLSLNTEDNTKITGLTFVNDGATAKIRHKHKNISLNASSNANSVYDFGTADIKFKILKNNNR